MSSTALSRFVDSLPTDGSYSVWASPLDGAAWLEHRERETHYSASTMKVALVLAAFREAEAGRVNLDEQVVIRNRFSSVVGNARFGLDEEEDSDEEPWRRIGEHVALRWLAYRSLVKSSNLATNLVLEAVGLEPVAEALERVGATDSVVARGIDDGDARDAGLENIVTARDLGVTLQALATGVAAEPQSCKEIVATLAAQQINDALPARLPPGTRVAHKSGWVPGVSHDVGIVYPPSAEPFVLAICTTSALSADDALDVIARGAEAAWADWSGTA
jgi:beta-lactamase class A